MPLLQYTSSGYPFTKLTAIRSADVVQCFADIQTLLNTTGLDHTNVQVHGLTRNGSNSNLTTGTANALLINDSSGNMSELPLGTGGQVPQVNAQGTGLVFASTPPPAATLVAMAQNYV